MKLYATVDGLKFEFDVADESGAVRVGPHAITLDGQRANIRTAFIDNRRIEFGWALRDSAYSIMIDGVSYRVELRDARAEKAAEMARSTAKADGEASIRAPIPGLVRRILVTEGQVVAKDQPVLTLDAMKLENELPSPRDGVVRSVKVQPGTAVEKGQVLVVIG